MTIVLHTPLDRLSLLAKRLHRDAVVQVTDGGFTVLSQRGYFIGADAETCANAVEKRLDRMEASR